MERYNNLHQHAEPTSTRSRKITTRPETNHLNIDDTDSDSDDGANEMVDPSNPWLDEWNTYFNVNEVVPEGMGVVQWWGVRLFIHVQMCP